MQQIWGAFSVHAHLQPLKAFVADVMLYERLLIPVPAEYEWISWERQGLDPSRQNRLLDILGNRAVQVPWDGELRNWMRARVAQRARAQARFL